VVFATWPADRRCDDRDFAYDHAAPLNICPQNRDHLTRPDDSADAVASWPDTVVG
jgi:hypothetical protein